MVSAEEAYKIAKEAYIFNFPLNYYYRTIHTQVLDASNKKTIGSFGTWRHDGLATPADTDTTMPNNDTPYSWAWVDVRSEPWVLIQPPADGNRFYSSVWGDLWGHIVDYPGSTNDGQKGGTYLLATTAWKGKVPSGIKRVIRSETSILGTLTRTAVFGTDDLAKMRKIQQGYKLMPLSTYLKKPAPAAAATPAWPTWNEADMNNADFFRTTNFLMQFVVPNAQDKPMYDKMAKLGIGPKGDYDPAKLTPDVLAAVNRGVADGYKEIVDGAKVAVDSSKFYGTRKFMGTRYLDRAVGVEAGGIIPNVPKQAFYGQWTKDANGTPLDGSKASYTFTFPKGQLPPVRFFFSLTMYDLKTRLLVDNPIDRYSIGDRTKGLKRNPDGSFTIYVQKDSPGKDKESNWLPAPNGPMSIISRMYGPSDRILKGEYKFPDPVKTQ
ncbi:DUF1214 domain-containing protein [Jeongeupia wiesaeckerbachi]|uniref:DUF1254 domain-containing protein n=1 Tax=Jeongeupia wiesaeckerbachi TaxID=3051218 RepID=UPI003D809DCC